ncbi:---NA--- [Paramuricea clavata]|uniref:---NA n=1 Tax=Paramuricea clavata TaxID=317549 RepID=A0A6S7J4K9_PARCT|nr:---NA--- [Paramuricea clavata]
MVDSGHFSFEDDREYEIPTANHLPEPNAEKIIAGLQSELQTQKQYSNKLEKELTECEAQLKNKDELLFERGRQNFLELQKQKQYSIKLENDLEITKKELTECQAELKKKDNELLFEHGRQDFLARKEANERKKAIRFQQDFSLKRNTVEHDVVGPTQTGHRCELTSNRQCSAEDSNEEQIMKFENNNMETNGAMASSSANSDCSYYRDLLKNMAQPLLCDDVVKLNDWASERFSIDRSKNAADVLSYLDRTGVIHASNLSELRDFFESINRIDLVHIIDEFLHGNYSVLQAYASKSKD